MGKNDRKAAGHGLAATRLGLSADAETLATFNVSYKKGTGNFGSLATAHEKSDMTTKEVPSGWEPSGLRTDPGWYDPNAFRGIAYNAKKTFHTSSQKGQGHFGGVEKRDLRMTNDGFYPPAGNALAVAMAAKAARAE